MGQVWTFVDIDSPVLNVYQYGIEEIGTRLPEPGAVWDFGVGPENTMHGSWEVLSIERPSEAGVPNAGAVRVNIRRHRPARSVSSLEDRYTNTPEDAAEYERMREL